MNVDLDDTSRCPIAPVCQVCEQPDPARRVVTGHCPYGVLCVTVCPPCERDGRLAPMSLVEVFDAIAHHSGHLGIDLDRMAVLVEAEQTHDSN